MNAAVAMLVARRRQRLVRAVRLLNRRFSILRALRWKEAAAIFLPRSAR